VRLADGVYFRREDYAPFLVRVLVDVIDLAAFGALCGVLILPVMVTAPFSRRTVDLILVLAVATAFFYFVVLKRSRLRTLGYRVGFGSLLSTAGRPVTVR
jgi:hypothetical protein